MVRTMQHRRQGQNLLDLVRFGLRGWQRASTAFAANRVTLSGGNTQRHATPASGRENE